MQEDTSWNESLSEYKTYLVSVARVYTVMCVTTTKAKTFVFNTIQFVLINILRELRRYRTDCRYTILSFFLVLTVKLFSRLEVADFMVIIFFLEHCAPDGYSTSYIPLER